MKDDKATVSQDSNIENHSQTHCFQDVGHTNNTYKARGKLKDILDKNDLNNVTVGGNSEWYGSYIGGTYATKIFLKESKPINIIAMVKNVNWEEEIEKIKEINKNANLIIVAEDQSFEVKPSFAENVVYLNSENVVQNILDKLSN